MGKTNPILEGTVSGWADGVTQYGFDVPRDGDLNLYILAHRDKDYEIARDEDTTEMYVVESTYRLYDPEELSVNQHNALEENGYHFHTITERDLIRMMRSGFDGRSCDRS